MRCGGGRGPEVRARHGQLNADHKGAVASTGAITIDPTESDTTECLWTFNSDCLLSDAVIRSFALNNVTGFETGEVRATQPSPLGLTYSQLVPCGWGGVADGSSGIELTYSCHGCGYKKYSALRYPRKLFNAACWDGSDVFIIWPLPRFIFVTEKVSEIFREMDTSGVEFTPIEQLDVGKWGFSPGRLSDHSPRQLALQIGKTLGID